MEVSVGHQYANHDNVYSEDYSNSVFESTMQTPFSIVPFERDHLNLRKMPFSNDEKDETESQRQQSDIPSSR